MKDLNLILSEEFVMCSPRCKASTLINDLRSWGLAEKARIEALACKFAYSYIYGKDDAKELYNQYDPKEMNTSFSLVVKLQAAKAKAGDYDPCIKDPFIALWKEFLEGLTAEEVVTCLKATKSASEREEATVTARSENLQGLCVILLQKV